MDTKQMPPLPAETCMRCGKPREITSRSAFRCLACAAEWRERMSDPLKRS